MFEPAVNALEIVGRTFVVYFVIVLSLRVFGKRELGQMTPFDLVLILTISNAVQNAMTGPDTSLAGGITAAMTLLVVNRGFNVIVARMPKARHLLVGTPTLLVHNGRVISEHLAREGIDDDELQQAIRQHGIADLKGVRSAVLEVDGNISIIPASVEPLRSERRPKHHRLR